MANKSSIFTAEPQEDRLVIRFRDWWESFYHRGASVFVTEFRDQVRDLVGRQSCRAVAIDMAPVDPLPSAFLGLIVVLVRDEGLTVELLRPSESARNALETTKLDQFVTIRENGF